jgi:UDP-N-acetylglucosamine acyltransferase
MIPPMIHKTAIIEDGAKVGANAAVGPYCHVGPDVVIGDNVTLHSHVVVAGRTTVGEGTRIFPFASIGHAPQDLKYHGEKSELVIGKNNTIREHVTMNPGTESGGMKTAIGDNCLFMMACHIAHDCHIGSNVIMANNATLGGHVVVGDHAVIGGLAAVHQFVRIGAHAVVGGMSAVENDVIPYGRVKGERAFLAGLNLIGLERRGFTKEQIKILQKAFYQLFAEDGTLEQRLESVEQDFADQALVMDIARFAREKTRFPLCQPPRKTA